MTPDRRRLAAYALVVAAGGAGFWRVESTVDTQRKDRQHDDAAQCMSEWRVREQIREAIPIPAEALIEVVADADPAQVDAYRQAVARRIEETISDPECDIDSARAVLDE